MQIWWKALTKGLGHMDSGKIINIKRKVKDRWGIIVDDELNPVTVL